jgi:hypothetical protein
MKLADLDKVNHLVRELAEIRSLIRVAEKADLAMFQLFIESTGDSSIKMSKEGASTAHSGGIAVSDAFLKRLRQLALEELHARRDAILAELNALGVDTKEG